MFWGNGVPPFCLVRKKKASKRMPSIIDAPHPSKTKMRLGCGCTEVAEGPIYICQRKKKMERKCFCPLLVPKIKRPCNSYNPLMYYCQNQLYTKFKCFPPPKEVPALKKGLKGLNQSLCSKHTVSFAPQLTDKTHYFRTAAATPVNLYRQSRTPSVRWVFSVQLKSMKKLHEKMFQTQERHETKKIK